MLATPIIAFVTLLYLDDACFIPPTILISFYVHMIILLPLVLCLAFCLICNISVYWNGPTLVNLNIETNDKLIEIARKIEQLNKISDISKQWKYFNSELRTIVGLVDMKLFSLFIMDFLFKRMTMIWADGRRGIVGNFLGMSAVFVKGNFRLDRWLPF